MRNRGFLDDEHREKFDTARSLVRRGGALQEICGAKTRSGQPCRSAPLKGHRRCLRHAGPKAARELRNRQLRALATGKLSVSAFAKLEARREANRLHGLWRRDPWVEGATIDLGDHEADFRQAVGQRLDECSPADADWLRWRYRLLQIDKRADEQWGRVVVYILGDRMARSGRVIGVQQRAEALSLSTAIEVVAHDNEPDELEAAIDAVARERGRGISWLWQPSISHRERRRILLLLVEIDQNPSADAWARWVEVLVRYSR